MFRIQTVFLIRLLTVPVLLVQSVGANDHTESSSPDNSGVREVTIRATDGRITWSEVIEALAESERLDATVLDNLPDGSIDCNDGRARFALLALNVALPDECSVRLVNGSDGGEPQLVITFDRDAALDRIRDIQRRMRERAGDSAQDYGLRLDEDWLEVSSMRPMVLLIHGFNSDAGSLSGLHEKLRDKNWPCAVFDYPNDGPIDESAALLAAELVAFRESHPERQIVIVAHSMGGLVARAVIEDGELNPGGVSRLIMIATPNQGSRLAYFPGGFDWLEHRGHDEDADDASGLFARATADGLNEASLDMWPDSKFLRRLNGRELNSDVRYTLLLGTQAPLSEDAMEEFRERVVAKLESSTVLQLFKPRIEEALGDLDELRDEHGDGAVAVKRGRLEGVEDTELLPITHFAMSRKAGDPQFDVLFDAVLKRLNEDGAEE